MKIEEMVKKYRLKIAEDGVRLLVYGAEEAKRDGVIEEIKTRKPEIMSYLKEKKESEERAEREREEKVNGIEGLKEIEDAIEEQNKWTRDFERMMDSEDGFTGMRVRPKNHVNELLEKYPRAAAYIKAYNLSFNENYELQEIGSRALEKIINGEDYNEVMNKMKSEKEEFVNRHIWD